jgi:hypothetical protein|eukprot:7386090-Prymnesium_polylepis.1
MLQAKGGTLHLRDSIANLIDCNIFNSTAALSKITSDAPGFSGGGMLYTKQGAAYMQRCSIRDCAAGIAARGMMIARELLDLIPPEFRDMDQYRTLEQLCASTASQSPPCQSLTSGGAVFIDYVGHHYSFGTLSNAAVAHLVGCIITNSSVWAPKASRVRLAAIY